MLIEPSKAQEWLSGDRTTKYSARAQLGPLLAPRVQCTRGPPMCWRPPVVSPSSCCIPWHRRIICPCCFRDINHLITLPRGHILPIQETQAGGFLTVCRRSVKGFSLDCQGVKWFCYPVIFEKNTIVFASCRLDGLIDVCLGRICRMCSEPNSSSWRTTKRRHLYTPFRVSPSPPTYSY